MNLHSCVPSRSALRKCEMQCANATSSTKLSGHTRLKKSSFSTRRVWLSTRSNRVSKTFGGNATGLPSRSNCLSAGFKRKSPNLYATWGPLDIFAIGGGTSGSISGMRADPKPAVDQSAGAEAYFSRKASRFPQDFLGPARLVYLSWGVSFFDAG